MVPLVVPPPLAIIKIGMDPVLFKIGGLSVHWYGVMYAIAFLTAFRYGVVSHLRRYGIDRALMERVTGWTILFGLIGARLYFVVQNNAADYLHNPGNILAVWEGGMAFFGAIGAAALTLFVMSRLHGFSFWMALDAGAFFATIGQPIGRIGNVINGDILGPPSTAPWATAYTSPHAILQPGFALCDPTTTCTAYQPAAVYEAIGTLIILGVLLMLRRRHLAAGVLGITYVALYAVSQLVIFHWRAAMPTYFGLAQAQWTAVATLVVAVPMLVLLWRVSGRGASAVEVTDQAVLAVEPVAAEPEGAAPAEPAGSAPAEGEPEAGLPAEPEPAAAEPEAAARAEPAEPAPAEGEPEAAAPAEPAEPAPAEGEPETPATAEPAESTPAVAEPEAGAPGKPTEPEPTVPTPDPANPEPDPPADPAESTPPTA